MIRDGKGNLFERENAGPWQGLVPVSAAKVEAPCHRVSVGKIPLDLVRQVTSFFEWSLKETGGETVVHLFYHEEDECWAALVLPQKGHTGMSVSLLADHPGRVEAIESLGAGWCVFSTWHHHCKASAFQSGTDRADEEDVFGLHVTVGNIGSAEYSLHARCNYKKAFTPAVLSDWVELPVTGYILPDDLAAAVVEHLVCQPDPSVAFPEWWKGNVIKVAPVQSPWVGVSSGPSRGGYGGGYQGGFRPGWEAEAWTPPGLTAQEKAEAAARELDSLAYVWQERFTEMADLLGQLQKDTMLADLIEVMVEHKLSLQEVLDHYEKRPDPAQDTEQAKWDEETQRDKELGY